MKRFSKLIIALFFTFSLTGCIGENYDFTPPTVSLSNPNDTQMEDLEEANINWRGENNKQLEKETKDILSLAKEQKQIYFSAGKQVDLLFDSEDFAVKELNVSVSQNDKKIDLELNDNRSFDFPKEKGKYVIEVNLHTDRGYAQYVGNVVIQ
ncbi:hypothetical protein [Peribacillus loiseleuriae]|uniref:Lipoprotein n=1 Tax=Peribacillus loiseleuriae TaxID=1679170 RepID=A0A0K9GU21_9BACI|nr:hypothetical protein [Peribacillus loiseleuriae]KMY50113.1 hypothetical protein AC625_11885 [Peribacillus loiseleuriae]